MVDVAETFRSLKPGLNVSYVPVANEDNRDYSVSTARLDEEGFKTGVEIGPGSEE